MITGRLVKATIGGKPIRFGGPAVPAQSPDEAALLAAICAEPDDDTARLVAADWYQENDQGDRAEFIRTQIAVEKTEFVCDRRDVGVCNCDYCTLRDRERNLLSLHPQWYLLPLPNLSSPPTGGSFTTRLTRGFISNITCDADWWVKHFDEIRTRAPITDVRLWTWPATGETADAVWFGGDPAGVCLSWTDVAQENRPGDRAFAGRPYSMEAILRCRYGSRIHFRVVPDPPPVPNFARAFRCPKLDAAAEKRVYRAVRRTNAAPMLGMESGGLQCEQVAVANIAGGNEVVFTFRPVRPFFRTAHERFDFEALFRAEHMTEVL